MINGGSTQQRVPFNNQYTIVNRAIGTTGVDIKLANITHILYIIFDFSKPSQSDLILTLSVLHLIAISHYPLFYPSYYLSRTLVDLIFFSCIIL